MCCHATIGVKYTLILRHITTTQQERGSYIFLCICQVYDDNATNHGKTYQEESATATSSRQEAMQEGNRQGQGSGPSLSILRKLRSTGSKQQLLATPQKRTLANQLNRQRGAIPPRWFALALHIYQSQSPRPHRLRWPLHRHHLSPNRQRGRVRLPNRQEHVCKWLRQVSMALRIKNAAFLSSF